MVDVRAVTCRFNGMTAVDRASLSLERGGFLTILGPSGCGKTTLLRMIAGFLRPDEGEIFVHGQAVSRVPAWRRSIGMVFQKLALFPHMTAAGNVAYPLKMRGFDRAEISDRVQRYLSIVRLDGLDSRRPHELSGGQQQRVAIARALVFEPDLLLLDEPLSALDRKLREEMQLEFRRIQRELGVTTINVTHDQREALVMSDRVVVMNDGVIQQSGDPVTLYRQPSNRFVAGFIGLTSFLRGRAVAGGIEVAGVMLRAKVADGVSSGMPAEGALRAERVRIGTGGEAMANRLDAVVRQCIFEGDRFVYELAVPALGDAIVYAFDTDPTRAVRHEAGSTLAIGWNESDMPVFAA
ncbi:MAG: ABC transporter ATP-binding protein [Geminicoccaceae bacterium]|nr:ABC transporter ATP-binding protein [Geminicoccaceae bacterium]MCB9943668.1 ABC transporter ATP-binding protein [Geminicoccaceae bacterium]